MPWTGIEGQDRAVRLLRRALSRGQPHHAYLFAGPEGVGKELLARLFAQAANCESDPVDARPCGSCAACAGIARGNFPDVQWILPQSELVARGKLAKADLEGAPSREIRVDEVRELARRLSLAPLRGRRKLAILTPAEALNERAQNTLLKTLEEPPPQTTFILVSAQPDQLLATVRSRCARVQLVPLPQAMIAARRCCAGWRPRSPTATSAPHSIWPRGWASGTPPRGSRKRCWRRRATSWWRWRTPRSRPPSRSRRRCCSRSTRSAPRWRRRWGRTATRRRRSNGSRPARPSRAGPE